MTKKSIPLDGSSLDNFLARRLAIFRTCDDLETIIRSIETGVGGRPLDTAVKISVQHRAALTNQVRVLNQMLQVWNDGTAVVAKMEC